MLNMLFIDIYRLFFVVKFVYVELKAFLCSVKNIVSLSLGYLLSFFRNVNALALVCICCSYTTIY
jgi:hypothetical protein